MLCLKTDKIGGSGEEVQMRNLVCNMFGSMCPCICELYLDIRSIKSPSANNLQQESELLSVLPASGEVQARSSFISSLVLQEDA